MQSLKSQPLSDLAQREQNNPKQKQRDIKSFKKRKPWIQDQESKAQNPRNPSMNEIKHENQPPWI